MASNGIGNFFTPQEAVDAMTSGEKATIQLFAGEWEKPVIPKGKPVKWKLRDGAKWK